MNYICLKLIKNKIENQYCGWINIGSLVSQRRNTSLKGQTEQEFY